MPPEVVNHGAVEHGSLTLIRRRGRVASVSGRGPCRSTLSQGWLRAATRRIARLASVALEVRANRFGEVIDLAKQESKVTRVDVLKGRTAVSAGAHS